MYFVIITQKIGNFFVYFVVIYPFFRCKFYSLKILPVKKMTNEVCATDVHESVSHSYSGDRTSDVYFAGAP